jgi:hypothetical protein
MEPNRVDVRHNNMTTESVNSFRADPAAVSALGGAYRSNSDALSEQSAQLAALAATLFPEALGPVGSAFAGALAQAAGRTAGGVAELGSRLITAEQTAAASAVAFISADAGVATHLGTLR